MDFTTMAALGIFSNDDGDDNEGGAGRMTDLQFKAFIRMMLDLANNTREVKEFRKSFGTFTDWGLYSPFTSMIINIADATGDMERVKQVLQDILKMSSASSS